MSQHMPEEVHATFDAFGQVLRHRAAERPDRRALTWLDRNGEPVVTWDFAALERRSLDLAAHLVEQGLTGQRALLMFPPGLDFIAVFYACLHAGVVAVPVYPPDPARLQRSLPRFLALVADCGASAVLTTAEVAQLAGPLLQLAPGLEGLALVQVDALGDAPTWIAPRLGRDDVAFVQYSSGSTGDPKGIVVTHGNLLDHAAVLQRVDNDEPGRSGLFWLPSYHDLGLIAGILQPTYYGVPTTLMSPIDFMKRPLGWLRAVSRFRPTHTGGPNFGYDLCVRRFDPTQLEGVDLSSVEVFVNAAERVRRETIDRFVETFAPYGVTHEQMGPAYGLAEATLVVCTRYDRSRPRSVELDRQALSRGDVQAASGATPARDRQWLVGVGQPTGGVEVAIVDPATGMGVGPGRTGEIWVHTPAVASGYLGRPELTEATFRATLPGDPRHWLRTGDVGFLHDGELFVTSRLKDLIILRGRNLAPEDVERSVEVAHPDVRPGCVAAFAVDEGGEERLVVGIEIRP
ncbi:MAG: fatty acyl-AMP ligase, partial [Myxococcales bacterium]|nr:fatty acyl-AMP ligase [Myxococcales bacterium]